MPHFTRRKKNNISEIVDVIDLTQDSPNVSLQSRINTRDNDEIIVEIDYVDPVILQDDSDTNPQNSKRKPKSASIITLEETIDLDDTSNNAYMIANKRKSMLSESPNDKKSLTCPICLENLDNENIKAMTTPCGHIFCETCLKTVTQTNKKCSICQRRIAFGKCIRLHI